MSTSPSKRLLGRIRYYTSIYIRSHRELIQWVFLFAVATILATGLAYRINSNKGTYGPTSEAAKPGTSISIPPLPMTYVFTHPEASLQPPPTCSPTPCGTSVGQTIRTIHDFNGKLYFGYGDWGANTGPIVIRSYDPVTGTTTPEYSMATEQIARFVTVGSRLYAAGIDPGGGGNEEYAYRDLNSSSWTGGNNTTIGFVHVFDIASLDGQGIWLCGATNPDNGESIYSPDGTRTWRSPQSAAPDLDIPGNSASAGFNRLYFCGTYNGKLYTQSPYYTNSQVYDPATNTWSNGPDLLPDAGSGKYSQLAYGSRPLEFAGKMVYNSTWTGSGYGRMLAFGGSRVTEPLKSVSRQTYNIADLQIYNGSLYVLALSNNGFSILQTNDLVKWQAVGSIPGSLNDQSHWPYSFRILNGTIYIGYGNSKVYSAPLPNSTIPLN